MPATQPTFRFLALLLVTTLLAACGKTSQPAPAAAPAAPPPPEVGVVTVQPGSVGLVTELPGRLEASRVAQVRARAAGIVLERLFREGSDVKAGQPLFRIDAAPYRAAAASADATLARAQANLANATALAERYKPLVEANAISKQEYANAVAALKSAEAEVVAGRAAVETARINLGYATVTAPISGRIGRALVTEGALVGQGEPTPLAVIQQIQPLYVNFTQSAGEVLALRRAFQEGKLERAREGGARVQVLLEDGSVYPHAGRLLFSDLSVDPATGQVTLRGEVPNPQGALLPGLYVRVRVVQGEARNAVLLPQQAVTRSDKGDSVMVAGPQGQVEVRQVTVGESQGNQWVILDGLKAGEQVIVDGFQKMRPGAPVKPVPWNDGKPAPAASPAPATRS
ncbi:efflux RND transporter periplasmic adaptor subunit [Ramlibacter sp. AW1]|uniref:Efflux RND transporter periplasmic adaptor subunit n=1 Tax=Ramlibacter aurantiacus TaxID=2801330 RepID=A0A936ZNE7_9BURK|nr:efflux RND transporter periplasmic adaptor subunit [Ramlibacter aurantiacus]MBL0423388.1 efflux RND transporter periplasmic adaptor subunit [Ramlibacter aurantiacus]